MLEVHSAPIMPRPGDRIAGKYRVEHMLGVGGMGCVLAAEHLVLRTRVAIKLLLPQASAVPGATERFLREAQAAAALKSEHVARVIDVGSTEAGAPFLVMEHLTGQDLRSLLRERGPLPLGEAVEYLLQTCDAVLEAHAQGIIHRDLKPANIFVTTRPNGTPLVKVLDFGLAKVLDPAGGAPSDDSITQSGLVVGSPHYMSPEQFRSLRNADVRSDIWAMGVIMYELVTGKKPFVGEGMSGVMLAVVTETPAPPRALRPDLPPAFEALILRCLDKTADNRPRWIAELVTALESLVSPVPSSARRSAPLEGPRAPDPAADSAPPTATDSAPRSAADSGLRAGVDSDPRGASERTEPKAVTAQTALVPGPGVLPPAPGRSTWRMVDSTPSELAAIRAVVSEAPRSSRAPAAGAPPGRPSTEIAPPSETPRGSRKWLVAGAVTGTLLGGVLALRLLTASPPADARDRAPATAEREAAPPPSASPASTQIVFPAPLPAASDSPAPPSAPAATAATASAASSAAATARASASASSSAAAPPPAAPPRPTGKLPSKSTAGAPKDDPFGKYD